MALTLTGRTRLVPETSCPRRGLSWSSGSLNSRAWRLRCAPPSGDGSLGGTNGPWQTDRRPLSRSEAWAWNSSEPYLRLSL